MVSEEANVREVVSSNPSATYWMDNFSHLFLVYIVLMFEINIREAGMQSNLRPYLGSFAYILMERDRAELKCVYRKFPRNNFRTYSTTCP